MAADGAYPDFARRDSHSEMPSAVYSSRLSSVIGGRLAVRLNWRSKSYSTILLLHSVGPCAVLFVSTAEREY